MYQKLALVSSLLAAVRGQQIGTQTAEVHPSLTWQQCAAGGSCTTQNGKVVIDANWRWVHGTTNTNNCYSGNTWDASQCPDDATCAKNCALEGADYAGTYGITTSGNSLNMKFITNGPYSKNIGSRLYLMADDSHYKEFSMINQEISFDVDASQLPCGLNGAVYFVSMDADGGKAKYPTNAAGAAMGTGYCDTQCPRDLKFINGVANVEGWTPSSNDPNAGVGNHGSCCSEMDLWEANSISAAVTPHSCKTTAQHMCTTDSCGGTYSANRYAGDCDADGCDFNSYRMGNTSFYGPGKTINTNQKLTVVTQFIGSGSTLSEIRRFYVQNGVTYANSQSKVAGVTGNSITPAFCDAQKKAFGDTNSFDTQGGFASMGSALSKGMVLVLSVWDDHYSNMLWLDSTYPVGKTGAGAARGTCASSSGVPSSVEGSASTQVTYSNIKVGAINSTFSATNIRS